jgi:copper(I)-binding protein
LDRNRGFELCVLIQRCVSRRGDYDRDCAARSSADDCARGLREIKIEDAWIRWLPADLPAAGYVRMTTRAPRAVTLVGAASPAYAHVSLHRSVTEGGNACR